MRQIPFEIFIFFVIPPQEPCFPAWDWIRNLPFGLKNGIFYSFELRQAIRMKTLENEVYACIFRKVAKIFVIPPHKPCFTAQNWIRNHNFKHQKIRIFNFRPKELPSTNNRFPSLLYHLRSIFDEIQDQKYEFDPIFGSEMLVSSFKSFAL